MSTFTGDIHCSNDVHLHQNHCNWYRVTYPDSYKGTPAGEDHYGGTRKGEDHYGGTRKGQDSYAGTKQGKDSYGGTKKDEDHNTAPTGRP